MFWFVTLYLSSKLVPFSLLLALLPSQLHLNVSYMVFKICKIFRENFKDQAAIIHGTKQKFLPCSL